MVVKNTAQAGHPIIREKAKMVKSADGKLVQRVIKDLIDSMRAHELVGMASPQIGQSLCIFVTEIRATKLRKKQDIKINSLKVFINPEITWRSKEEEFDWEGCGSVANSGLFGKVKRPVSIIVIATNEMGEKFKLKATGLLARVIQHEMDHLNGVIFTDHADPKTYMSQNEYLKMRKSS